MPTIVKVAAPIIALLAITHLHTPVQQFFAFGWSHPGSFAFVVGLVLAIAVGLVIGWGVGEIMDDNKRTARTR